MRIAGLMVLANGCGHPEKREIDLSGAWRFQVDSLNQGLIEKWCRQTLPETIVLPGSMAENGKGDEVTLNTRWTGLIVDHSWFTEDKYARYRKEGNIKIPFGLQPVKHYVGAAWCQREVEIPDAWEGQCIELHLEWPHWETQIWVDGHKAGMKNSLGTAHVYRLGNDLKPGNHLISIRVDNSVKEVDSGMNSHSITDHTQSNWNGIVGEIVLKAGSANSGSSHFGEHMLKHCAANWALASTQGDVVAKGILPAQDIPIGNGIPLGKVVVDLKTVTEAQKLILTVDVGGYANSWDIWVYPAEKQILSVEGQVKVVRQLNQNTITFLENGGKVLKPVVRAIDDWFTNWRLALLFEAKVGKGKLMVSGINLLTEQMKRPETQQLIYSLKRYMAGNQFHPVVELDVKRLFLFREFVRSGIQKLLIS